MSKGNRLSASLLALTLASVSFTASATVVYNWETLSTSDALTSATGQLAISDAAWQSGGMSVDLGVGSYPDFNGPVENFLFTINGADASMDPVNAPDGFEGALQANMSANPDGTTNGSLYANNTDTEVEMAGSDRIWQILMAGSDNPAIGDSCYFDHSSCKATGQWLLDPATVPALIVDAPLAPAQKVAIASVPEPGARAMFGLALALVGVALVRRRRVAVVGRAV